MDKDEMKESIKAGELLPVLENDQLRVSCGLGIKFPL
jgi:hypothetical protein